MLAVLGLIDVVMIANLLIMVIIGGYETFVSRIKVDGHPDQPEWLSHVNANVLKVKLAMAIIGISSIHLLKTFIEVGDLGAPGPREHDRRRLHRRGRLLAGDDPPDLHPVGGRARPHRQVVGEGAGRHGPQRPSSVPLEPALQPSSH